MESPNHSSTCSTTRVSTISFNVSQNTVHSCNQAKVSENHPYHWKNDKLLRQFLASFAASISAFGMGSVEAYTSPALPSMKDTSYPNLSITEESNIASVALIAALVSGPIIGKLIGRIGRKSVLILTSLPFAVGWLLIASAKSILLIYIGRLLTGFCAGTASLVVPIFISEISEDKYRGMLCSGFQFMVTLGNFGVYAIGSRVTWQWLAFVCSVFPIFGLVLMIIVPATPAYLVSRGRIKDAQKSLLWLRATKNTVEVHKELMSLLENQERCKEERQTFSDIFKLRTIRPLVICVILLLFQQLTGIEVVLVYTVHIFESSRVSSILDPYVCAMIVGGLQVLATLLCAMIVDKAGRRRLLMVSELGAGLAMAALGLYFQYIEDLEEHRWIPIALLSLFIVFFSFGAGPVPFLMVAELNSIAVIGIASAGATTFNWTFAYIATAFFMDIEQGIGFEWCFQIFALFSFLAVLFVFVFVPETKGKSKEDIQNYFRHSVKIKWKKNEESLDLSDKYAKDGCPRLVSCSSDETMPA